MLTTSPTFTGRWKVMESTATVAVDSMTFHRPVKVGDVVSIYARIVGIGRTSIRIFIEAWRLSREGEMSRVTSATFIYVAIGPDGRPRPVDPA